MKKYKNKGWLKEQYVKQKIPATDIASDLDVSYETIYRWLENFGIKRRKAGLSKTLKRHNHLTPCQELHSYVIGGLLGDGHIASERKFSGMYQYVSQHKAYIDLLSDKLNQLGMKITDKTKDSRDGNIRFRFRSRSYPYLKRLRQEWYNDGIKIVPDRVNLTPIAIREWFLGDGELKQDSSIVFHTEGFTKKDVQKLVRGFKKLGILSYSANLSSNCSWPYIHIQQSQAKKLFNIMANLPSQIKNVFGYKWDYTSKSTRAGEKWLQEEIKFLADNYEKMTREKVANKLNRSKDSVSNKYYKLND